MIGPGDLLGRLWRFLRTAMRRKRFEDGMAEEIRDHLERRVADLMHDHGLSHREAQRRARLEFGSVESTLAQCRDARRLDLVDELVRNLRHALRVFSRSPGLTLAITATLALGIGVNVAVFTVVDAALLRPLQYPDPDRLVLVETRIRSESGESVARAQDGRTWQALAGQIEGLDLALMSFGASGVNAVIGDAPRFVTQQRVSAGFFRVLGVPPRLGRGFTAEEDVPGGPAVAVLSHGFWQQAFGGGEVSGRSLQLRGERYQVVGVMPEDFRTDAAVDVWTPLRPTAGGEGEGRNYVLLGRLQKGASPDAVAARVRAAGASLQQDGSGGGGNRESWLALEGLQRAFGAGIRDHLLLSWATAWLVLVVGCINVAGLLLAHAGRRGHEIATRLALGGGRGAIVRQLLTESLVLSLVGTAAGVAAGVGVLRWLSDLLSARLGLWQEVQVDGRMLWWSACLALMVVALAGLLPAWRAARLDLRSMQGGHGAGRGVVGDSGSWPRRALLVAQMAVVVSLLVAAGLLARTVLQLQAKEPGFDPSNLTAATVSLQDARYEDAVRTTALLEGVAEDLRRRPGIEQAAAGLSLPYERPLNTPFLLAGEPERLITNLTYVTPGYFETLGMTLLQGRVLGRGDSADAAPVAVVNRDFVRSYLKDREPLGARLRFMNDFEIRIVGVVADTQQRPGWGDSEPLGTRAAVYVPVAQVSGTFLELVHRWFRPSWVVRATARTEVAEQIRDAVAAADPQLPLAEVRSLRQVRDQTLAGERIQAGMVSACAALALVLAAMGLAGLIASSVTERRRELGLRMALGATRGETFQAAVRPGLRLALVGLALGLPMSLAVVHGLRAFLYGVSVYDPATYAAVCALLLAVAALASAVPALRVLRLDPAKVLRAE